MSSLRPRRRSESRKQFWNWVVTIGSVFFCLLILPDAPAWNGHSGRRAKLATHLDGGLEH